MAYILLIIGAIVLDQAVKLLIASHMMLGETIVVIPHFFSITYIHNTGAAFGLMAGHSMFLILLPAVILAAAAVYLYIKRRELNRVFATAISLIIAGGIGNIIDRAVNGYVIDFLDFKVWNPIFNIADIAVCVGCGLVILYVLVLDRKDAK